MLQQLLLNGIIAGSIYALIAIGFTIIYRTVESSGVREFRELRSSRVGELES